jgi:glutaredoxin
MSVEVVLYGAPDCGLCDEAKRVLESQAGAVGFELRTVDISGDEELERRHRQEIPLVTVDGRRAFKFRVDPTELRRRVLAAKASQSTA